MDEEDNLLTLVNTPEQIEVVRPTEVVEEEATLPRPGMQPHGSWFPNNGEDKYPILMPLDGRMVKVQFIHVDLEGMRPKIYGTQGRGCPVVKEKIYARKDPYPCPQLTRKQRFAFAPNQEFTGLVDDALQHEHDLYLLAKVITYQRICRQTNCPTTNWSATGAEITTTPTTSAGLLPIANSASTSTTKNGTVARHTDTVPRTEYATFLPTTRTSTKLVALRPYESTEPKDLGEG
ncbi:hypothetical protein BC827DRAFT_1158874 [Russula dissimulans]|nr:hypothetical protein BC827DRAFT_1158874 [Russula dissimulans]